MQTTTRLLAAILLVLFALPAAGDTPEQPQNTPKVYVCPMPDHPKEYSAPGQCPLCGMELVEKGKQLRVAVLVFDGVEDIDFTAPIEVLGQAGALVFTVAPATAPVQSVFGLHVTPDYDLEHAPPADLVLLPGGATSNALGNLKVIDWIRQRSTSSRYVMSVCNGAFFLAKAGLLDGLSATTTASRIEELAEFAPKARIVRERLVDNGKVLTTAGLSAGIDGSLHIIDREYGRERAEEVARGIEYNWQPDSKWTASRFAEHMLPDIHITPEVKFEKLSSHGDMKQWELRGRVQTTMPPDALLDQAATQIVAKGWKLEASDKGTRRFRKTDREGQAWIVTFATSPDATPSSFVVTASVGRVISDR